MADLLDIVTATAAEVVRIDGERTVVRGLQAQGIASIAARFPNIVVMLSGGDNVLPKLIEQGGEAVGPIIAAATGHLGDEKYEHLYGRMLLEHQLALLSIIYRLTFPNGVAVVMKAIEIMTSGAVDVPKPVKVRLKKSPSASQPSSDADSRPTMQ